MNQKAIQALGVVAWAWRIFLCLVLLFVVNTFANATISGRPASTSFQVCVWMFFISSAIMTFEKRVMQLGREEPELLTRYDSPGWMGVFMLTQYGALIGLVVMNWKFALYYWVAGFIMAVLPIFQTFGQVFYDCVVNPLRRRREP
jgi:hypothetical protein